MGNDDKDNVPKIEPQNEPQEADPDLISYEEKGFDITEKDIENLEKKK